MKPKICMVPGDYRELNYGSEGTGCEVACRHLPQLLSSVQGRVSKVINSNCLLHKYSDLKITAYPRLLEDAAYKHRSLDEQRD